MTHIFFTVFNELRKVAHYLTRVSYAIFNELRKLAHYLTHVSDAIFNALRKVAHYLTHVSYAIFNALKIIKSAFQRESSMFPQYMNCIFLITSLYYKIINPSLS